VKQRVFADRYKVQHDSFGLKGENNEVAASIRWLSRRQHVLISFGLANYDIDFTQPHDESGKKTQNAVVTIKHNGVAIYETRTKATDACWRKKTQAASAQLRAMATGKLPKHLGGPEMMG
jgi:hypothetical protein